MSNSLDPDQARRFVGPDLGPNCLPRLSADDTGRPRVKFNLDTNHIYLCMAKKESHKGWLSFYYPIISIVTLVR